MDPSTVTITTFAWKETKGPLRIIKRHLRYITNYRRYIVDFQRQLEQFEAKKLGIQEMVDTGFRNLQEPGKEVEVVLRQSTEFKAVYAEDLEILKGLNLEIGEKYFSRYKLSKKAIELGGRMKKLMVDFKYCNPPILSQPPPKAVEKISTKYKVGFNSIEMVKIDIMSAIKNANTSVIGLHGMGGIGKTTLMQQINNELKTDTHSFTYVIMVTVSNNPNIKHLQDEIGLRVGLEFNNMNHDKSEKMRACRLLERLEKEKSILIILDDVWKRLDLAEVGIPNGNGEKKCCKIVLTSRNKNVCKEMSARPIISMTCLSSDESWKLFESDSISAIESESIRAIAKDVCKECAGLPLAISVVASTLRHEKEEQIWAFFRLKMMESNPMDLDGIESKVYTPLKLSYDHLGSKDLKLCFLFCSLFPEDHEINLNDLMYYGIGEGFVTCCGGISSLDYSVHKLKMCGLLLDAGNGEISVKMHDVIRDVAIFIAMNDKELDFYTNFQGLTTWPKRSECEIGKRISLMGNSITCVKKQPRYCGKRIKTLLLNGNKQLENIDDNFFQEMEDLLILDLSSTSIKSLPSSFCYLIKLRVLMVSHANKHHISKHKVNVQHVFSMINLSVLYLRNLRIPMLTGEFGELVHLRVLDFTATTIDIIWPNVLSKLEKLEQLLMVGSFNRWNDSNEDGNFVSFFELGSLKHLYRLQVDIVNEQILSKEAPTGFLQSLKFFAITFDTFAANSMLFSRSTYIPKENLLSLKGIEPFSEWIEVLMKKTETLALHGCNSFQQFRLQNSEDYSCFVNLREIRISNCKNWMDTILLNLDSMNFLLNLRSLLISKCKTSKDLIEYMGNSRSDVAILPKVEVIDIRFLDEMENIFVIPTIMPIGSFQSFKNLFISWCPALRFIFPWNVAVCLVQLEELEIGGCFLLNVIFEGKHNSDYNKEVVLFPKLKYMALKGLPNLESLWQQKSEKIMEMQWSSLGRLEVRGCMKLKRLFFGERSALKLQAFYCGSEEWFDQLQWEDEKTSSRFKSKAIWQT